MKTSKREVRKPEMAIYRPGMGLQNKKNDDQKLSKSGSPDSYILEQLNTLIESDGKKTSSNHVNDVLPKSSKNVKNRRPDIQVYTPKPKIAAQLNNKKTDSKSGCDSSIRDEPITKSTRDDSITKSRDDANTKFRDDANTKSTGIKSPNSDAGTKSSAAKRDSKFTSKLVSLKNTNEFCGDVNDSDVSNSRSSPDKLHNSYTNETSNHSSTKHKDERHRRHKKKSRSNSGDAKKHSVSQSRAKEINLQSSHTINSDLSYVGSDNQSVSNDRHSSLSCDGKEKYRVQNSTDKTTSQSRSNVLDSKVKSDRKKRTDNLPPRLQNKKNQESQQNASSKYGSGSGGILKLPVDFDRSLNFSEVPETPLLIPKIRPEPQTFIHKTLFDPNNPSKPEVVNIPAPHSPHMPYCNIDYPDSSSFMAHSVQSIGYIPPPQPPILYKMSEMGTNFTEDFLNRTDVIPAPVPVPTPVYCRPAMSYPEMSVPPETGKKRLKPIVESNLREIALMERELALLLSKGLNSDTEKDIQLCRSRLQFCYADIILADPTYCAERNPEQSLWRTAFHQIIELYRKQLDETTSDHECIKGKLLELIFHGSFYLKNLIAQLEEKFGFTLEKLLVSDTIINMAAVPEKIKVVLISVQKIYVYLGDLARYKERVSETTNYGKARSYYQKASQILPKNGRPYYQLALVSVSTRRKLDAVYYYIRSLAASNPILSAKESLLTLFEEVKRKYEIYEKKRIEETPKDVESLNKEIGKRVEVWIKPDGSSNQRPAEMDNNLDSSDVKNLSDAELNKRFVTSFLHVHGKLFTKVGMEKFPETLNQMLKEFYFLLQRTPLPITSSRLMQLLAINIFSVDNSSAKEAGREHRGFSLLQEQALYTSMAMMSILMERCHMLHIAHKSSPEFSNHMIGDDLAELLPSVKIWTNWMSCQKALWAPPPNSVLKELNVGFAKNIWTSFADLLTVLREVDIKYPETSTTKDKDCDVLILEEDNSFAGFVPLLGALQDPIYILRPYDKVLAKYAIRINRIQFFGDYLCGITPAFMEFDVESKKFISLVNQIYSEENYERSSLHNSADDVIREDDPDDNFRSWASYDEDESNELQMLWSKKEKLSKTKEQQEKYKAEVQAVLRKHESQRSTVLKIQPKFLIPDTNCFIDHLRLFTNILALSNYHLIVPLVVINELDGLARGTRVNEHTSPEHANRVTILSREAVHFLEKQFAVRNPHVKAITSKGSILDTISFRSEEMGKNKGTNDDLILSCCLYYCKDRPEEFMPKKPDEPVTLFREVVLLTDDRNLRVKALAHNVPVRDLQSFLQWVNS